METFLTGRSKSSSNTRAMKLSPFHSNLTYLAKPSSSLRSCKIKTQKNSQFNFFEKKLKQRKISSKNEKILIKTLTNTKCSEFFQKKSQENQEDLKKIIQRLESEVKRLKKENFELKEEVRSLTRDSRDSFMSGKVFASCLENLIDIQEFWHIMNPNNLPLITRQELKRAVRGLGIQIKDKKIDFFFERLSQGSPRINEDQFLERIIKFKPSVVVTLNDLKFALKSMKPLKNTINLEDLLLKTLKHPKISLKETFKGFKSIFQDIPDENLEIVVRGIFSFESQLKTIEIPKKLKNFLENQDLFN